MKQISKWKKYKKDRQNFYVRYATSEKKQNVNLFEELFLPSNAFIFSSGVIFPPTITEEHNGKLGSLAPLPSVIYVIRQMSTKNKNSCLQKFCFHCFLKLFLSKSKRKNRCALNSIEVWRRTCSIYHGGRIYSEAQSMIQEYCCYVTSRSTIDYEPKITSMWITKK
ncbi:CLUMA_CG021060, isoform A [Clunio marinus]|uniref:CLUMA_CG021060, isoform A n=1 Tax=Clunio marinus TaxID=568069 RepID=A0A1J1J6F3_9DIPT|nr:CLUMA_CG021060, isoform A [Clunio marinus]